jgi:dTDP-4-dehydrorhamnose 3,5-epimerase
MSRRIDVAPGRSGLHARRDVALPRLGSASVEARELGVPGAWLFSPPVFPDARGAFAAPFQAGVFADTVGHPLHVAQANTSVSRRGVLRGVHYADVPPGQAKYVQCSAGAVLDVVVDVRIGSPTFGAWDAVRLDGATLQAVYLAEGLGHAFLALEEGTVTTYLCSREYEPAAEHGISPLDPALGLPWERWIPRDELVLSDKDAVAPALDEAHAAGTLPTWAACRERHRALLAP